MTNTLVKIVVQMDEHNLGKIIYINKNVTLSKALSNYLYNRTYLAECSKQCRLVKLVAK